MNEQQYKSSHPPADEYDFADDPADDELYLPHHLVQLPGGSWALWSWAGLRAAGFPGAHVLELADPACAAAADQLIDAEDAASQAKDALQNMLAAALDARLDALLAAAPEEHDQLVKANRRLRQRAVRNIKQGTLPEEALALVDAAAVDELQSAIARLSAAREHYRQALDAALARQSSALRDIAADDRFSEAIIWQNRHAFHTGIRALLHKASDTPRGSKHRQHEELLASYVQRYCVKNDTIGFFGPVGWARVVRDGDGLSVYPGPDLIAARNVYYEAWCLDTLVRKLAENRALRPWIAPRRMPFVHLDGNRLYLPHTPPSELPAARAAVLRACDGVRLARDIAANLVGAGSSGLQSEEEVYQLLRSLSDQGIIVWALELPFELRPEQTLQRLLERIGDESLRRPALDALAELEAARRSVAQAQGNPEQLDRALEALDETFTRLTNTAAMRSAGQMYAGRTLVYEDCRRDIEVELGPKLLDELGPPLSLLLTSARWLTFQVAGRYRELFRQIYAELTQESGSPTVDLVSFWLRVQSVLFSEESQSANSFTPQLQERWAEILALPEGQHRVAYTAEELRPRVQAAFAAPDTGWQSGYYHSPDVMIAAPSVEDIQRGDYQLVMGELHIGINTLSGSLFVAQHPDPEELLEAFIYDVPDSRLVPVISRNWFNLTVRTRPALISPRDYRLLVASDSPGFSQSRALPIGSLVTEEQDGELVIRTRDGRLSFDIVETFASLIGLLVSNDFQLLRPHPHTPRVTVDRVVICRETWRFAADQIPFATIMTEAERFIAARRWTREHGIPRFAFVKAPVEVKPFYVDFDSPIYVAILAKIIRRTLDHGPADARITVTEMLPDLEHIWLPDAQGRRYTSELRLVAVDLAM